MKSEPDADAAGVRKDGNLNGEQRNDVVVVLAKRRQCGDEIVKRVSVSGVIGD